MLRQIETKTTCSQKPLSLFWCYIFFNIPLRVKSVHSPWLIHKLPHRYGQSFSWFFMGWIFSILQFCLSAPDIRKKVQAPLQRTWNLVNSLKMKRQSMQHGFQVLTFLVVFIPFLVLFRIKMNLYLKWSLYFLPII